MNPIKELIYSSLSKNKESRADLINRLGYKNQGKGLRRLDNFTCRAKANNNFIEKLSVALNLDKSKIDEAINSFRQKSKLAQEKAEQLAFSPHLWIKHEREYPPVGSICLVGLIGIDKFKKILLPENIIMLSWAEQIKEIRYGINLYNSLNKAGNRIFGAVTGYIYRKEYDVSFELDINGSIKQIYSKKQKEPKIYIDI
ncbi:MAG: hypothetical protein GTO02_01280 [Candidatus Dadabacteria bacterium]|nr:hypothetical protein [Candidatus Dadabacteria bacterium]